MKKLRNKIIIVAIIAGAFIAGFTAGKGTYISRMNWALDQIVYWEPTNAGMDIYDIKGNLYIWD